MIVSVSQVSVVTISDQKRCRMVKWYVQVVYDFVQNQLYADDPGYKGVSCDRVLSETGNTGATGLTGMTGASGATGSASTGPAAPRLSRRKKIKGCLKNIKDQNQDLLINKQLKNMQKI